MPGTKIDGVSVAAVGAGAVLLYAGITGKDIPKTLQAVIQGKAPSTATQKYAIQGGLSLSGGSGGGGSGTGNSYTPGPAKTSAYKAYATLLIEAEWPGQFGSFNNIVMAESGWNPQATNPGSGAFGIAQALGHGNANTAAANGENNYGNYGTSDATCKAANEGSGQAQIRWMVNYIRQAYGSPDAAWQYHLSSGAY